MISFTEYRLQLVHSYHMSQDDRKTSQKRTIDLSVGLLLTVAAVGMFLVYWLAETNILILLLAAISLVSGCFIVERSLVKNNRKYARVFIIG